MIQKRITTWLSVQPVLLEVVVDRRHQEDALAGALERNLDDHRQRFEDEQAADDGQDDLVLGRDGDGADQAAERQRPVSPMKIAAGGALYQRKPRPAPMSAPRMTASSPVPGTKWICR